MNNDQETVLSAVWLLATLNGNNKKTAGRKNVAKIDIVEACQCIIDVSESVNLRKTSNLMYGTVLAYKNKCLWNWKDVNMCRMLIQRLGVMTTSSMSMSNKSIDHNSEKSGIKLLIDDPKFDIMHGLVNDYDGFRDFRNDADVESLLCHSDSGEEELGGGERDEFGGANKSITQDKWDKVNLDFQFDENGELVQNEEIIVPSESEIRDSFVDFNAFEDVPEFELGPTVDDGRGEFINDEANRSNHFEAVSPIREMLTPPPTKRKRQHMNKDKQRRTRKRLVIDQQTTITGVELREIRDGYIRLEIKKREDQYAISMAKDVNDLIGKFIDLERYKKLYPKEVRGVDTIREEGTGANHFDDFQLPSFEDIEYGRERMRSRSSSVSSVELGRRAVDSRHSSSFRFDFSQHHDANGSVDNDVNVGDIAQLDITFGSGDLENVSTLQLDEFEEEIDSRMNEQGVDGDGTIGFKELTLTSHVNAEKNNDANERVSIVCSKFMFVLQLATSDKIGVEQSGLFSEIYIKKKKKTWI